MYAQKDFPLLLSIWITRKAAPELEHLGDKTMDIVELELRDGNSVS